MNGPLVRNPAASSFRILTHVAPQNGSSLHRATRQSDTGKFRVTTSVRRQRVHVYEKRHESSRAPHELDLTCALIVRTEIVMHVKVLSLTVGHDLKRFYICG